MAIDEKRRQKKLLRKRRKDKERRKTFLAQASSTPSSARSKILGARNLPIHECLINPTWKEHGLANILIARRQSNGKLLFGAYLVDCYCLGLKNTFCNADLSPAKYSELVRRQYVDGTPMDCPIDLAHTIIYGGIEYAEQLGFQPNKDFRLSRYVLEDKDSIEPCEGVEFGRDGKPFFIAGPDDDVKRIMKQLESRLGHGNFEFMYPMGEPYSE